MSTFQNANLTNFSQAFNRGMAALNLHMHPQNLMSNGRINFGPKAARFVRPLDGSLTEMRDSYILLSARSGSVRMFDQDDRLPIDYGSKFLSDIELLNSAINEQSVDILEEISMPGGSGQMVTKHSLRKIMGILSGQDVRQATPGFLEGVKRAAAHFRQNAFDSFLSGQTSELETAKLFFIAGLLSVVTGVYEVKVALFEEAANAFSLTGENYTASPVTSEMHAWFLRNDPEKRNSYLVQVADRWDDGAKALYKSGDATGAIIAIYRGLQAASISGNYEAMSNLFTLNAKFGSQQEVADSFLLAAQAKLKMREIGLAAKLKMHGIDMGTHGERVLLEVYNDLVMARKVWDARTGKEMGPLLVELRKMIPGDLSDPTR